MDKLFLSDDVLDSELEEVLGGIKIRVVTPNGIEIVIEL